MPRESRLIGNRPAAFCKHGEATTTSSDNGFDAGDSRFVRSSRSKDHGLKSEVRNRKPHARVPELKNRDSMPSPSPSPSRGKAGKANEAPTLKSPCSRYPPLQARSVHIAALCRASRFLEKSHLPARGTAPSAASNRHTKANWKRFGRTVGM
ncbi:hypothetical protein BOC41_36075 [Burkholderia pseudomallei]|nr:hypothetical protein BOC37_14925 [Burkholderia pseudomallei]ARL07135.1 hypothetical protein BOC44_23085 [Burkholderia pseudomallei]ARL13986.1 hypothetical protein BOC45_27635 [Burkholderia pseudomallei]OSP93530.1 hypothetical protein BOC41_36075 [Burkholderia pseudomallei]